jgi:hypothetical protein
MLESSGDTALTTADGLAITQWMQSSILNDAGLLLPGVPTTYSSMNDIEMDFVIDPEVVNSNSGLALDYNIAASLFAAYDPESPTLTLLNPKNMYDFYYTYYFNKSGLTAQFGIPQDQADPLMLYLEWIVQHNKVTFYGTATSKAMTTGLSLLEERLPVELATRSLALYNYQNQLDCTSYFEQTGCVIPDLATICAKS